MVDERPATLAVVDGGMICGWRRATPSLEQLDQALQDLRRAHPGLAVAVVGDPALKHSLPAGEQERLEAGIATRSIVLAPAGTIGGFTRFLAEVVRRAEARGLAPVVVTDQAVGGATLGQARIEADRWTFDLGPVSIPEAAASAAASALADGPVSAFVVVPTVRKARSARSTRTSEGGGRSGSRRKSKRVARGSAKATRPMAHDRLLQAMAVALAEADPDGRLVDRMVDPEAVGRAAARALLRSTH